MAVYTHLGAEQIAAFLELYDLGALKSFAGIEKGVSNTNYHLYTERGHYILTLVEKRHAPETLPFVFSFMEHLGKNNIYCPRPVPDKNERIINSVADHPAIILTFVEGCEIEEAAITPGHCRKIGEALALMHEAAQSFPLKQDNPVGLLAWKELFGNVRSRADEIESGLAELITDELAYLEKNWPERENMPQAAIHADLFPDNVFFKDNELYGFIDFYFSCTDFLVYDLAIVVNSWCFATEFQPDWYHALIEGYQDIRPLTEKEKRNLSLMCRGASLRILLSRLEEYLFYDSGTVMKPKNPEEYIQKLRFHQNEKIGHIGHR